MQEHAVLHTSRGLSDCRVEAQVTVGHRSILHGCTVQDQCIIGMGSVILDGTVIGVNSIVGAQALVPMNLRVPAKVIRQITAQERQEIKASAAHYIHVGQQYKKILGTTTSVAV